MPCRPFFIRYWAAPMVRAYGPKMIGPSPSQGHSPFSLITGSPAGHSPAAHRGGEAGADSAKFTEAPHRGGEAGADSAKFSETPNRGGEAGADSAKFQRR